MASSVSVISSNHPSSQHHMDRLDAARALLGVSPASSPSQAPGSNQTRSRLSTSSVTFLSSPLKQQQSAAQQSQEAPRVTSPSSRTVSFDKSSAPKQQVFELAPPVVISTGLDALAALASSEQAFWQQQQRSRAAPLAVAAPSLIVSTPAGTASSQSSSSSSDEDSEAMPPPPPRVGGRRRSVSNPEGMEKWAPVSRRHFVLPASILEEELAEASAAMEAAQERKGRLPATPEEEENEDEESTTSNQQDSSKKTAPVSGLMSEEEQANLTPEELLKRARSRLLEDLSEGSLNGEKNVLPLPHSLLKYKEVYNKNGRIGIYTPAERAAIIARFNSKRSRRVWNKKIRYNCRKNLADRRMRVKGRFVKRSTEEQARAEAATPASKDTGDEDMPDITDPDAGFCPTEDQPYRRTRRHTIT